MNWWQICLVMITGTICVCVILVAQAAATAMRSDSKRMDIELKRMTEQSPGSNEHDGWPDGG